MGEIRRRLVGPQVEAERRAEERLDLRGRLLWKNRPPNPHLNVSDCIGRCGVQRRTVSDLSDRRVQLIPPRAFMSCVVDRLKPPRGEYGHAFSIAPLPDSFQQNAQIHSRTVLTAPTENTTK